MREPKPYALADKTAEAINAKALQRLRKAKQQMLLYGFDELNVTKQMTALYRGLIQDNRKYFVELFVARYFEIIRFLRKKKPQEDEIYEMAEMWVAELLDTPLPQTHYAYAPEIYRKRDRAAEAVNSVAGNVKKQVEMDKHLRYWLVMTAFYIDFVSDGANEKALKDSGVMKVQWNTQEDGKVCATCNEKNGNIYDIDKIPKKPHVRCRCWVSPIT